MKNGYLRLLAATIVLALVAAACNSGDSAGETSGGEMPGVEEQAEAAEEVVTVTGQEAILIQPDEAPWGTELKETKEKDAALVGILGEKGTEFPGYVEGYRNFFRSPPGTYEEYPTDFHSAVLIFEDEQSAAQGLKLLEADFRIPIESDVATPITEIDGAGSGEESFGLQGSMNFQLPFAIGYIYAWRDGELVLFVLGHGEEVGAEDFLAVAKTMDARARAFQTS